MTKDSIALINGHEYKYKYNPDTKTMDYLGPVGDAPPLTEREFNLTVLFSGVPTVIANTKKGVVQLTPEPYSDRYYEIKMETSADLSPKDIFKMFKRARKVKRVRIKGMDKDVKRYKVGDVGDVEWWDEEEGLRMMVLKDEWPPVAKYIDEEMSW
jgi:hypothetical protein